MWFSHSCNPSSNGKATYLYLFEIYLQGYELKLLVIIIKKGNCHFYRAIAAFVLANASGFPAPDNCNS